MTTGAFMTNQNIKLLWEDIVSSIRAKQFEPTDVKGQTRFMYCRSRNAFISDPYLIKQIVYAREHESPFMLIGNFGTGKNIFLELVAQGDPSRLNTIECVDENVDGSQEEMLNKFFGPHNIVEQHPNSLFHFDLLQNAVDWPVFLDRVHELARKGILYRTDGKVIKGLNIRVVGGATADFPEVIDGKGASIAKYLYEYLCSNQLASTKKLSEQTERIEKVLAELLAAQILDTHSSINEDDVRKIEFISFDELEILHQHNWPKGFYELVTFVRNSITEKRWILDHLSTLPKEKLRVFISHSFADSERIGDIYKWLLAHNVAPWVSSENLLPGEEWEFSVEKALHGTDLVIVCLSKAAINKEGYVQKEIRRALELVERMPDGAIFLVPLRLEDCKPPLRLSKYHYVDYFDPKGQNRLILALKNRAATLGRAAVGPKRYLDSI